MVRQIILLCLICVVAAGCSVNMGGSSRKASSTEAGQLQVEVDDVKSLGSLHTRKLIVRLESGGKFSIMDLDGELIAMGLSKTEFQEKFPQVYDAFEKAYAGGDGEVFIIDASIERMQQRMEHILISK